MIRSLYCQAMFVVLFIVLYLVLYLLVHFSVQTMDSYMGVTVCFPVAGSSP